jgi:hypothetical protein
MLWNTYSEKNHFRFPNGAAFGAIVMPKTQKSPALKEEPG